MGDDATVTEEALEEAWEDCCARHSSLLAQTRAYVTACVNICCNNQSAATVRAFARSKGVEPKPRERARTLVKRLMAALWHVDSVGPKALRARALALAKVKGWSEEEVCVKLLGQAPSPV